MFQMRGKPVGAAYTMRPEEKQGGAPPHWNSYVTVANVDESAKKAASLGGKIFAPPFDVMDAGRMAVVQDPTGAVFQIWQKKRSIGAEILNEPGALCWTELTTSDHEGGGEVLHRTVRLDAEALRAEHADGIHRVQRQRSAEHRHDGEAAAHAGGDPVGTGCRISRSPMPTPASPRRRASAAR